MATTFLNVMLVIIACCIGGVIHFLRTLNSTIKDLNTSAASMPNVIDKFTATANMLNDALKAHKVAIDNLPTTLSNEVERGLNPIAQSLKSSSDNFKILLEQMPNAEKMPDWLLSFSQAIEPLKKATETIQHFEKIATQMHGVVDNSISDRTDFKKLYEKTTTQLDQWTTNQEILSEDFRKSVQDGMASLQNSSNQSQVALEKVSTFISNTERIVVGLDKHLPGASKAIYDASTKMENTVTRLDEIAKEQATKRSWIRVGY
ncbi:MAG: hypothetical protein RLZZ292_3361 [Bacteroidota bacterium]|jgi:chromosome segregation ATPase